MNEKAYDIVIEYMDGTEKKYYWDILDCMPIVAEWADVNQAEYNLGRMLADEIEELMNDDSVNSWRVIEVDDCGEEIKEKNYDLHLKWADGQDDLYFHDRLGEYWPSRESDPDKVFEEMCDNWEDIDIREMVNRKDIVDWWVEEIKPEEE